MKEMNNQPDIKIKKNFPKKEKIIETKAKNHKDTMQYIYI